MKLMQIETLTQSEQMSNCFLKYTHTHAGEVYKLTVRSLYRSPLNPLKLLKPMKPYNRNTACIHCYMHPKDNQKLQSNIYVDGQKTDLKALLITAARIDQNFHDAFLEAADWLKRDEANEYTGYGI